MLYCKTVFGECIMAREFLGGRNFSRNFSQFIISYLNQWFVLGELVQSADRPLGCHHKALCFHTTFYGHRSKWCSCNACVSRFPTASMQEINLPLTPEACRETGGQAGAAWWQWAETEKGTRKNIYEWFPIMWESSPTYEQVMEGTLWAREIFTIEQITVLTLECKNKACTFISHWFPLII